MKNLPVWLQAVALIGLPGFIALYLLGAFDAFMPSPVTAAIRRHEDSSARVLRLICRGVWQGQGNEAAQLLCD